MISASHNPYYDNGIKLINGNGEKMEQEVIDKVEEYLDGDLMMFHMQQWTRLVEQLITLPEENRYMGYLMTLAKNSI